MSEPQRPDVRLIEAGFPCHQVGAETRRERDTGKAPPPNRLHVWWARRPLTPSRAAILASLLPADTDPLWFLRQLGIEKRVAFINGQPWTLTGKILDKIETDAEGREVLVVDGKICKLLKKENTRRAENRETISQLKAADTALKKDPVLMRWESELRALPEPWPENGELLEIRRVSADPAWSKERIAFENTHKFRTPEDKYGYSRAYSNSSVQPSITGVTVLDPTSGGGSIPFEALRLGHQVIANELNPVASVILHATLDYPGRFGTSLVEEIKKWGKLLRQHMVDSIADLFPSSPITGKELSVLRNHLKHCIELLPDFSTEILDGFLYCRQVTCPHCNGEAPLLNTCWLSREAGKQWGVRIITDGSDRNGTVRFETFRVSGGKGPGGEDPNMATVNRGVGMCVHCRQAIEADEIKAQARGESPHGRWRDRLYTVVSVRFQPKLDDQGQPLRYKSGPRKNEIKTEKIRFFRPPNAQDLEALRAAEKRLDENWESWERKGLIPTENIPPAHKTKEPLRVGINRWCDMFTPRQLLGHLTLIEELNRLKPQIMRELGEERGRAVVTYLQFAIDKGVDYNSRLTTWENTRNIVKHVFARHDFSLTWTFGEMIFRNIK